MEITAYKPKYSVFVVLPLIAVFAIKFNGELDYSNIGMIFCTIGALSFYIYALVQSKWNPKYRREYILSVDNEKIHWSFFDKIYFGNVKAVSFFDNKLRLSNGGAGYSFLIREDQQHKILELEERLQKFRNSQKRKKGVEVTYTGTSIRIALFVEKFDEDYLKHLINNIIRKVVILDYFVVFPSGETREYKNISIESLCDDIHNKLVKLTRLRSSSLPRR